MISGLHKGDTVIFSNMHLLIMQISAGQHFVKPKSNNIFSLDSGKGKSVLGYVIRLDLPDLLNPVFLHHFPHQLMCDGHLFAVCLLCQTKLIILSQYLLIKENKNSGLQPI